MKNQLLFEKLNIDAQDFKKLNQIIDMCQEIEITSNLCFIAHSIKTDEFGQKNIYGKNDFVSYKISKQKADKSNVTNSLEILTQNKSTLSIGLNFYTSEKFAIKNINSKKVQLSFEECNHKFAGADTIYEQHYTFNFDKKNNLERVIIQTKSIYNQKSKTTEQVINKKQLAARLNNTQDMSL